LSDLVHQVTLVIGLALFTQFALLPNHTQADANQHEKGNHDGNKKQNNLSPITVWKHSLILKRGVGVILTPAGQTMSWKCHGKTIEMVFSRISGMYRLYGGSTAKTCPD